METWDNQKIQGYCQEALEIAEEYGVQEGLAFLIGEKLFSLMQELKTAESHVKFLYNVDDQGNMDNMMEGGNPAYRESYTIALQTTYQKSFEKIEDLKRHVIDFKEEIREIFELSDIEEYLNSYPRMGQKIQPLYQEDLLNQEETDGFNDIDDVLLEVDDIFTVEEMKRILVNNETMN